MDIRSHKNRIGETGCLKLFFYIIIFISMFVFFYMVHPFILYDTDDWYLISMMRKPFPIWGSFNPGKVFPEVFMPLCGLLGSYLVYPFKHDYLLSISLICAIVASLFITAYIVQFDKFMTEKFDLNFVQSCCLSILFLSIHFMIFKKESSGNVYLLGSQNVCCFFNYTIPALLNAALVLFFMREALNNEQPGTYFNGGILLLLYLAIFSNLFSNIILAMYAFYEIMLYFLYTRKKKEFHIFSFLKQNILYFSILFSWLLCLVFEFFGQRSAQVTKSLSLKKAFLMFAGRLYDFNYTLLTFFIVLSLIALFLIFSKRIDSSLLKTEITLVISCFLITIYLILLAAVISPAYMRRPDIIFDIFFYVFLGAFICLGTILTNISWMHKLLPLLCFIFVTLACNPTHSFRETNAYQLSWEKCYEISNDMIKQIQHADQNNLKKITLQVPLGSASAANWPHATYLGEILSATLDRHGIISSPIEIQIEPSSSINAKYCIP